MPHTAGRAITQRPRCCAYQERAAPPTRSLSTVQRRLHAAGRDSSAAGLGSPPRPDSGTSMRYLMKRRVRPLPGGCLRDSRGCMGTFAPERQSGIKLTCGIAVPTLKFQREPVAQPPEQQTIAIQIPIERLNSTNCIRNARAAPCLNPPSSLEHFRYNPFRYHSLNPRLCPRRFARERPKEWPQRARPRSLFCRILLVLAHAPRTMFALM